MNKTGTEKILKYYSRIDDDIRMCRASLEEYEERYNTIGAVNYDGMPKGSGTGDRVAKRAIKNAETDIRTNIEFLQERIRELNLIKMEILKELTTMRAIQKTILTEFYIKGTKWEQIAKQAGYSVRQMQNYRTEALETMTGKIMRNQYLSENGIIKNLVKNNMF